MENEAVELAKEWIRHNITVRPRIVVHLSEQPNQEVAFSLDLKRKVICPKSLYFKVGSSLRMVELIRAEAGKQPIFTEEELNTRIAALNTIEYVDLTEGEN